MGEPKFKHWGVLNQFSQLSLTLLAFFDKIFLFPDNCLSTAQKKTFYFRKFIVSGFEQWKKYVKCQHNTCLSSKIRPQRLLNSNNFKLPFEAVSNYKSTGLSLFDLEKQARCSLLCPEVDFKLIFDKILKKMVFSHIMLHLMHEDNNLTYVLLNVVSIFNLKLL